MQYAVIIPDTHKNKLDNIYPTPEKAEKRHGKVPNSKIIKVPEFKAGLILYKKGVYYKTIIRETKTYWDLMDTENPEDIPSPILKENLLKYFVYGILDEGREEIDIAYIGNCYKGDEKTNEIEDMLVKQMGNEE